ncbi:hypothetical protein [Roseateles amylovorans]|uniref:Uncharacterized protein n=1 Tax=Roseateles amylovorans TaxID=2978473 RepID=A0ABY6AX80_9BURK|nr:hypothetical protein [Roseateles amylovorans]UXH77791.1 hypothetical protein N4261_22900 [Roseateles amylovorans]
MPPNDTPVLSADPQTYTADGLQRLAAQLNDLAAALPVDAPGPDGLEAMRWAQSLGGAASNLILMAVEDHLTQTAEPLAAILEATQAAQAAVGTLAKIEQVVEIVSDVLLLSTVIWLRKWSLVTPTLKELRNDLG